MRVVGVILRKGGVDVRALVVDDRSNAGKYK